MATFRAHRFLWLLLAITAAAHGVLMVVPPLTGDEALYWSWSRHPALGYPTHPPLTGWAIGAVVGMFGTSLFTVRLTALLFQLGTVGLVYRLSWELSPRRPPALLAAGLYAALPVSVVLGTTITTDCSLVFFWAATLYLVKKAVVDGREKYWYAAGLAGGGMLLSKFFAGLFFPAVLLFLLLHPRYRKVLATRWPYLGFLVTVACLLPYLYWNATHDWLPFQFNLVTRQGQTALALHKPLLYLAGQLLAASPFAFLFLLGALGGLLPEAARQIRPGRGAFYHPAPKNPAFWDTLFLYGISVLVPLAVFLAVAPFARIGAHWTASVFPAGMVMLAVWLCGPPDTGKRVFVAGAPAGVLLRPWACRLSTAGLAATSLPLMALMLFPRLLPDRLLYYDAPPAETQKVGGHYFGYRELGIRLDALQRQWSPRPEGFFLSTEAYPLAGLMSFYTPGHPDFALVGFQQREFHGKEFLLWGRGLKQAGANSVFVADKPIFPQRLFRIAPYFQSVEALETLVVRDAQGRVVRKFFFALCRGYLDNEPDYLSLW